MHKFLYLIVLALAVAVIVPVAALADDPLATIKADITQLQTDVKTKHDAVLADAQTCRPTRRPSSAPTRRRRRQRSRSTS